MKRILASMGLGLVVIGAFLGCSATGDVVVVDDFQEPEAPQEDGGRSSTLPPPSNDPDDDEPGVEDGGKKDSGGGGGDAGKDSGPPAPMPGDTCLAKNQIVSRLCGKCGKQETICEAADDAGALEWSDYGTCNGESGSCLPGETRPCGNCGTQTCTSTCGWSACGGQPTNHCTPGSVAFTGAGCPSGGLRSRVCNPTCQWSDYSAACESGPAVELWGGIASATYARTNDGKLYAWGDGTDGQLGDGTTAHKQKMGLVPQPLGATVSVSVSHYGFTCGSFSDGSAKCWGANSSSYGLGDGTNYTSLVGVTPSGFGANVVRMSVGYYHGCGLFADGSAKCWGYNTYGQLGNGNTTTSKTPVAVGLNGISQLYSGYYTVCARKDDEGYCWGYNNYGQVGDGTTTNKSAPTLVLESGVSSIAPGYYHTCARMTDGTSMCWGYGLYGRLGNNTTTNASVPTQVSGIDGVGQLTGVEEVCTGYAHSCARLADGRIACWGYNNYGQLGTGTTTESLVPKVVSGIANASKLVCGYNHTCAIDNGYVNCWGYNNFGQLGDGTTSNSSTPHLAQFL